ncbi:unnamed protein product, partial [Ectocarpus sp. 4 AP-2014]
DGHEAALSGFRRISPDEKDLRSTDACSTEERPEATTYGRSIHVAAASTAHTRTQEKTRVARNMQASSPPPTLPRGHPCCWAVLFYFYTTCVPVTGSSQAVNAWVVIWLSGPVLLQPEDSHAEHQPRSERGCHYRLHTRSDSRRKVLQPIVRNVPSSQTTETEG